MSASALGFWKGKKVFITGHTGFKGAWLTVMLLEAGAEVTGYSVDIPTQPSLFEKAQLASKIHDIRADILDFNKLLMVISETQPDIIFHLAAQPLVRTSYDMPSLTFATNLMGTVHVLEAIRMIKSVKAAVIVTTDKCYENKDLGEAFKEADPLGGKDPYSASKACAEIATSSYTNSFFKNNLIKTKVASARAGNVIGGGDWAPDRLIPDCIRAWESKKKVQIRNPSYTRPWQHVLEPLWGYLQIGENLLKNVPEVANQAFNLGPGNEAQRNVGSVVTELQKTLPELNVNYDSSTDFKVEAKTLSLNIEKALQTLKWRPLLSFAEAIEMTALWYRNDATKQFDTYQFTAHQLSRYLEKVK